MVIIQYPTSNVQLLNCLSELLFILVAIKCLQKWQKIKKLKIVGLLLQITFTALFWKIQCYLAFSRGKVEDSKRFLKKHINSIIMLSIFLIIFQL